MTKYYEEPGKPRVWAIDDVSIHLKEHEIFCLVGPSGCGKTTILNMVAGFVLPSSGSVLVTGSVVDAPHSRCGVVFQEDAVFPWLSVAENVRFGLRQSGLVAHEQDLRISRSLSSVGLSSFADRWPRELSGGMRKRVDLARAFVSEASVMLLDEPFGSLDVITKGEMQDVLLEMWRSQPKTILFVTHDIEEALYMGHRIAVMSHRPGKIKIVVDMPFTMSARRPELRLNPLFIEVRRRLVRSLSDGQ